VPSPGIRGLFGRPFIDLEPYLDLSGLDAIHEEICLGLASVPVDYTGGSHRTMGIIPPSRPDDVGVDYGEVIRSMTDAAFETFRSLADVPDQLDPARRADLTFGEERAIPLSRRQMHWLKVRYGVYFPWKAYVELIPNRRWEDKASPEGKQFTRLARTFFPKTIAFVESLPFSHIGRCNIMGLESFDHGTVHRDGEPDEQGEPDEFITFVPGANKRLFLWDDVTREEIFVDARAYWFNDFDYHGVVAAPHFRYSVRVDGAFVPELRRRIAEDAKGED
jgi:hypothetical protein